MLFYFYSCTHLYFAHDDNVNNMCQHSFSVGDFTVVLCVVTLFSPLDRFFSFTLVQDI